MPKTSQELGLWIKNNKDRKGSSDFNKVALAWKQAKERENNPYFNQKNAYEKPVDTSNNDDKSGLGDALEHSFLRAREGSLGYIADVRETSKDGWLQKGLDNIGEKTDKFLDPIRGLVGVDTGEQLRDKRVVTEDAEIADTRKTAEQMGKEADALDYKGWSYKDVKGLGDVVPYALSKIVESVPYLTSGPALLMTAIMPGELNQTLKEIEGLPEETRLKLAASGGAIMGALDVLGIGAIFKGVNKSVIGALDKAGVAAILTKRGVGANVITNFLKGGLGESATEWGQEVTAMTTEYLGGGNITKAQAKDRMLEAAIGGFTVGGSMRSTLGAASDAKNLFTQQASPLETNNGKIRLKSQKNMSERDAAAFTAFANRLRKSAEVNETNFKDVNKMSTKGTRQLIDTTHKNLVGELKTKFKEIKPLIKPKDGKTFKEIKARIYANVALEMGRNKTKSVVGKENYLALESLVGDLKEGQEAIELLEETDVLTHVHNNGYQGGLSSFTDNFKIFGSTTGYDKSQAKFEKLVRPGASTLGAVQTSGLSLIPQVIVPPIGTAIDKVTGNYSKVEKFIKQNEDKGFLRPEMTLPSLAEQKKVEDQRTLFDSAIERLRAEETKIAKRDLANESFEKGDAPTPGSPQDVLEQALGVRESDLGATPYQPVKEITPQVLVDLLEKVKKENETSLTSDIAKSAFKKAVNEYQTSIKEGGKIKNKMASPVIRKVVSMAEKQGVIKRRTTANSPGPSNTQMETPAISRGIADNQRVLADLTKRAKDNSSVEPYRAPLEEALNSLGLNLGTDPVSAATDIVNKAAADGVPNKAIKSYLRPYVDRIVRQAIQSRTNQFQGEQTDTAVENNELLTEFEQAKADFAANNRENSTVLNQAQNLNMGKDVVPGAPKFDTDQGIVENEVENDAQINLIREPSNKAQIKLSGNKIDAISGMSLEALEAMTDDQMLMMTPVEYNHYSKIHVDRLREETGLGPLDDASTKPTGAESKAATEEFNKLYVDPSVDSGGKVRESKSLDIFSEGPALNQMPTALDILPDENEVSAMRDPKWKPEVKRSKEEAAQFLQDRWEKTTGRTTPFEYTEENVPVIADIMVAEAMRNLESDGNAIGWYDEKIKSAKAIVALVEPRVMQSVESEAAFDFVLAVTSNGQAVTGNFKLALEVFRTGMDNGKLPENFNKSDRAAAMNTAFKFYNAYEASGAQMPIHEFMDRDYTVKELKVVIKDFNAANKTNIKVPSSESVNSEVKGSYILGPKIGQGFYQNIRGNYDPLTMDLWWMRTWNRMVGRPFSPKQTDTAMAKTRDKIATEIKKGGKVETQIVNETLKTTGETKKGLYKNPERMDAFVKALDKRWNKYYKDYQDANNKKNPPKPQLFKSTGTFVKNSNPQMQAQPSGPDRPYMRKVVEKALDDLMQRQIHIKTADFQALMWYPEKLLYKKMGVAPGNGADTDYQDAATLLAKNEGISDGQIEEALRNANGDGAVNNRPSAPGANEGLYPSPNSGRQNSPEGPGNLTRQSRGPALTSPEGNQPRTNPPSVRRLKPYVEPAKKVFEIGKPGGDLEDGVGTLGEALEMARGLNLTVTFLNEMAKGQTGEYAGMADVKGADGVFRSTTKANVRVLKKGSDHPMFAGQQITSVKEFTSLMHEIAHGLAIERTDRVPSTQYRQAKNEFVLAEQALETVKVGSFEDFILDAMENYESQGEVLKEIVNLQENIDVEIARKPHHGTTGVRPIRQVAEYIKSNPALRSRIDDNKLQEINNKFRRTYLSTVAEMAVDPLWVYLINPKLLKKVAPNTAKAIRKTFNNYGGPNQPVTFYSYPLATIMAIVVGVVANLEEEEEKRNAQPPPPPGALSPDMNMGALSA